MSARQRRGRDEPRLCCAISEQLAAAEAAAPHLRAAKRELLLFVRALVERELARMADEETAEPAGPRRRRVDVRAAPRRRPR